MIFSHQLEPNHHFEEYLNCDEADFIRLCTQAEEEVECEGCGHCIEAYFACSEDEYEAEEDYDNN